MARRKKKKEDLAKVMVTLNIAKQDDSKMFNEQMEKIAEKEKQELDLLEKEL